MMGYLISYVSEDDEVADGHGEHFSLFGWSQLLERLPDELIPFFTPGETMPVEKMPEAITALQAIKDMPEVTGPVIALIQRAMQENQALDVT